MDFKHIKPFIVAVIGCGLLIEPFYHNNEEKQKYFYNVPIIGALSPKINTFEHTHTDYSTEHIRNNYMVAVSTSGISAYSPAPLFSALSYGS